MNIRMGLAGQHGTACLLLAVMLFPLPAQAWHARAGGGARTFVVPPHSFASGGPHEFSGGAPRNANGGQAREFNGGQPRDFSSGQPPHPPNPAPQPQPRPPSPGPQPGPHPPGPPPRPMPPPPPPPPPYHPDDWYHPWATAAVIGATTATAVAIGTAVASVPATCVPLMVNGVSYQQCGSTWYQPQYAGTQVQYVVVVAPR